MKWVTRERPVIDRIACPWLIARFIDKQPEFLFVPPDQVSRVAAETGAIPYEGTHLGSATHSIERLRSNWDTTCVIDIGARVVSIACDLFNKLPIGFEEPCVIVPPITSKHRGSPPSGLLHYSTR